MPARTGKSKLGGFNMLRLTETKTLDLPKMIFEKFPENQSINNGLIYAETKRISSYNPKGKSREEKFGKYRQVDAFHKWATNLSSEPVPKGILGAELEQIRDNKGIIIFVQRWVDDFFCERKNAYAIAFELTSEIKVKGNEVNNLNSILDGMF